MSTSERTSDRTRVVIIDDHPAIRVALGNVIESKLDLHLCGQASSADAGFRLIEKESPDVAIVDISLEDAHGLDLVQNVTALYEDVKVLVFSMYNESVYAERALQAGAHGYLMKSESPDRVVEGIRAIMNGEVFLSSKMVSQIIRGSTGGEKAAGPGFPINELTDREITVFQMLGEGYSIEQITDRLNLNRKTVETYRRRAKEKLGLDSVSELLQYAIQWTHAQPANDEPAPVGKEK